MAERIEFPQNPHKGFFVAIEGLDGSGQSTQIDNLSQLLKPLGLRVLTTKEPTNRVAGGMIRSVLLKEMNLPPDSLQAVFAADRMQHLKTDIEPVLSMGGVAITDRYFWSSFAYGGSEGVDVDWLMHLNKRCLIPDVTIFLNVSAEVCIERMGKDRFHTELFEEQAKLANVHNLFCSFRESYPDAIWEVDGTRSPD